MKLSSSSFPVLALAALAFVAACDRHSEDEARAIAAQWFDIGETLHFDSRRPCTAAVFRAQSGEVKSRVPLFASVEEVIGNRAQPDAFAISNEEMSVDALFVAFMEADRATGLALQETSLAARACMDDATRQAFYSALTVSPSVLVFSAPDGAIAILDPVRRHVVMTSGAVQ